MDPNPDESLIILSASPIEKSIFTKKLVFKSSKHYLSIEEQKSQEPEHSTISQIISHNITWPF